MTTQHMELEDEALVAHAVSGDRSAYGRIVQRYQSLICGITYAGIGDVHRSEDLAQETFIQAWRSLVTLKDPGKLRAWLCGIARNLISNDLRRSGGRPQASQELDEQLPALGNTSPPEEAISKEEQSLIWAALDRLPIEYREPMVLYYRHEESVAAVANALDLTEDAARQRLVRGRAMLAERLDKILRRGLRDTAPTNAFALQVMSALPVAAFAAKTSALGAAMKGSTAAKTIAAGGMITSVSIGPLVGLLGAYAGYRNTMNQMISPTERRSTRLCAAGILLWGLLFILILLFTSVWSSWLALSHVQTAAVLTAAIMSYAFSILGFVVVFNRRLRRLRAQLIVEHPELAEVAEKKSRYLAFEYQSPARLLGVPLIHINTGAKADARPRGAVGWIAVGGKAYGLLVAVGGIAIAPISFGGISIGVLSVGGLAAGLFVWGGVAVGALSVGGMALGWKAFGGCAVAWSEAQGGVAVAHAFAEGGIASAQHANDPAARAALSSARFFRFINALLPYANWIWLLYVVPMIPILGRLRRQSFSASE